MYWDYILLLDEAVIQGVGIYHPLILLPVSIFQ